MDAYGLGMALSGTWARTCAGAVAASLLLVLAAAAARTPDAVPQGINRPRLDPDPIAGKCWPLPTDRRFGFDYQVRGTLWQRDAEGNRRRLFTLHYDLVDADQVATDIRGLLTDAGFVAEPTGSGDDPRGAITGTFDNSRYGTVRFEVQQLEGIQPETVVRGVLHLDLPAGASADQTRGCRRTGARA